MLGFKGIRGWIVIVGAALAVSLVAPSLAAANTIVVDTTSDTSGAGAPCTLREAITNANADTASPTNGCAAASGADTINFNLSSLPATINLTAELPHVTEDLSIIGPGTSQLDIHRTSGNFRMLTIAPGSVAGTELVKGLTLSNGNLTDSVGAGISNQFGDLTLDHVAVTGNHIASGGAGSDQGGGIFNNVDGTLHLVHSTVGDNHITLTNAGFLGDGGGIFSGGPMTAVDSTISDNDVTSTVPGSGFTATFGGGIFAQGATTITRSTISGNTASANSASGIGNSGGGGLDYTGSSLNLRLSTVAGNTASAMTTDEPSAGGGLALNGGGAHLTGDTIAFNTGGLSGNLVSAVGPPNSPTVRDTIISNPFGANCSFETGGQLTSLGFNVEDDATGSCLLEAPHDLALGTDPLLNSTLALNGGPTENYALQTGSPAIEAGSAFGATTDQRGLLRRSNDLAVPTKAGSDGSDIGAFEVQGQPFPGPPPPLGQQTPPANTPVTSAKKKCKKHKRHSAQSAKKKKCKKKRK